jgi:predicted Zn-dependent protease
MRKILRNGNFLRMRYKQERIWGLPNTYIIPIDFSPNKLFRDLRIHALLIENTWHLIHELDYMH